MIDPSKATPQASLALRATATGAPSVDDDDDDDDDDDGPPSSEDDDARSSMDDHEPNRDAAERACSAAVDAYKASKGTDSAAALLHAEEMSAAARAACLSAEGSSAVLRGAPPDPDSAPPTQRPGSTSTSTPTPAPPGARAPTASTVRAIVTAGGSSLAAQTEIAARLAFADRIHALFGGASLDASEGLARAAKQDAREALQLRASAKVAKESAEKRKARDAEATLRSTLKSAVRAGKYARAELFDVSVGANDKGEPIEVLTPKDWLRSMAPAALASMIEAKQANLPVGDGPPVRPDESPVHISAAVRAYGAARGYSEAQIVKLSASMSTNPGATAPTEAP